MKLKFNLKLNDDEPIKQAKSIEKAKTNVPSKINSISKTTAAQKPVVKNEIKETPVEKQNPLIFIDTNEEPGYWIANYY